MPSKSTKKKTAPAVKKPRGRKSAQNEVFDEVQAPVVEAAPEVDTDTPEHCPVCEEPVFEGEHICEPEHDAQDGMTLDEACQREADAVPDPEPSFHGGADEDDDAPEDDDDAFDEPPGRTRYLECDLTKADIDEKRAQREAGDVVVEKLEAQLAGLQAEAKTIKTRIEGLVAEGKNLSKVIRSGKEFRNVPCEERRCENEKGVAGIGTVRLDTFEQIEWRELTLSERQGRLFS